MSDDIRNRPYVTQTTEMSIAEAQEFVAPLLELQRIMDLRDYDPPFIWEKLAEGRRRKSRGLMPTLLTVAQIIIIPRISLYTVAPGYVEFEMLPSELEGYDPPVSFEATEMRMASVLQTYNPQTYVPRLKISVRRGRVRRLHGKPPDDWITRAMRRR
jgi:hypothetical protein